MDLGLRNKNVLVVGASKGIGRQIAISFAGEQARVTTIARSKQLLQALDREMHMISGSGHAWYEQDLMVPNAVGDLMPRLLMERGVFDIVIHCVGGSLTSRNMLGTYDEWLYAWKFNAGLAIDMNHYLLPPMLERGWGRVIHVSSISARTLRGNGLYSSAKAFLNSYVTTLGRELAASGVVVSAVMPGAVAFEGSYWDKRWQDTAPRPDGERNGREICMDYLRHHQAANRFGTPEEIADLVLFLSSSQASFMQGCIIPVDGGSM